MAFFDVLLLVHRPSSRITTPRCFLKLVAGDGSDVSSVTAYFHVTTLRLRFVGFRLTLLSLEPSMLSIAAPRSQPCNTKLL